MRKAAKSDEEAAVQMESSTSSVPGVAAPERRVANIRPEGGAGHVDEELPALAAPTDKEVDTYKEQDVRYSHSLVDCS